MKHATKRDPGCQERLSLYHHNWHQQPKPDTRDFRSEKKMRLESPGVVCNLIFTWFARVRHDSEDLQILNSLNSSFDPARSVLQAGEKKKSFFQKLAHMAHESQFNSPPHLAMKINHWGWCDFHEKNSRIIALHFVWRQAVCTSHASQRSEPKSNDADAKDDNQSSHLRGHLRLLHEEPIMEEAEAQTSRSWPWNMRQNID